MKKRINIAQNGHPRGNEDLINLRDLTLQLSIMETRRFRKAVDEAWVVEGCKITETASPTTTVSEGYICIDDQLFHVPETTVNSASGSCSFQFQKIPKETPQYADGSLVDVSEDWAFVLTSAVNPYDTGKATIRPGDLFYLVNAAPSGTIRMYEPPAGIALADVLDTGTGAGKGIWKGWTLHSQGRVLAGYLDGDADYGTIGNEFGENTHLLTSTESGVKPHAHSINDPGHDHQADADGARPSAGSDNNSANYNAGGSTGSAFTGITIRDAVAEDADNAHENRQPTRVCLIFKRD